MTHQKWQITGMSRQVKNYAKEAVRAATGREVADLLLDLYVGRRHTQEEIASALGVSRSLVAQWLREYGITRDARGPVEIAQ